MVDRVRRLVPLYSFEELGALHRLGGLSTFDRVDRQLRLAFRSRVILLSRLPALRRLDLVGDVMAIKAGGLTRQQMTRPDKDGRLTAKDPLPA